jgi:hypothetical protein
VKGEIVAFLGPSLARGEAAAILPDARFETPVRRGDLYRARYQGASALLIVDGQYLHEEARPIREVIDVARDGALVCGASSMGALRAAECGPVGVRGVGLVYRLFRSGRLESDDEVAVATDPDDGFRATSIALVNVRYATRRAVRAGLLDRPGAANIVEHARRLFYPERAWATVLGPAGYAPDSDLAQFCAGIDLKRDDAVKLLRTAAADLATDPARLVRHRRAVTASPLAEKERQRLPDPLAGRDPEACSLNLTRWMVGTGRCQLDRQPVDFTPLGLWATLKVDEPEFARGHWNTLAETGELDAELMRMQAVDEAVALAGRRRLRARAIDHYLAQAEIAARYRCGSWNQLERLAADQGLPWAWIEVAAGQLALAKRVRSELTS